MTYFLTVDQFRVGLYEQPENAFAPGVCLIFPWPLARDRQGPGWRTALIEAIEMLCRTAIDPGRLKLELTESLVLDNVDDTIAKMQVLKQYGVRFSLDDFGTGYSSLAYLSRLPFDQVKIDQSFVGNIGILLSDQVIVQTIIGMADNLGINVIAEGVETEAQLEFLVRYGCPAYQGYLFGRPMPLLEFQRALAGRTP